MTITQLKEYILNHDKVKDILDDLGCHGLREYNKEYRCGLPDHKSTNNVAINKITLLTKIFTSDSQTIRGDIANLIMYVKNISFPKANKYLHELFGLKYTFKKDKLQEDKIDPLDIFKRVKRKRYTINVDDMEIYDEDIIKEYIQLPYIDWIREGILPFTCEKFKIGYSAYKKRITIPWRWWCGDENDIVGVMGRSLLSSEQCDMLDVPKYFPLKAFSKSLNIYGLQENYNSIQKAGYVVVAEAEKSVLKRHSRKDETVVAIGSHDLSESDEQVKILIRLNVEIIIGFDQGVSLQHIRFTCSKFYRIREVSYIYDRYDLLKEKESPMDATDKLYKYLFKHRTLYDEKEHQEYLKEERNKNEKRL
jgi:DNA primase